MTSILCVDDNEANRYLLLALLKRTGFEAFAAEDGMQGVDMALAKRPDLVLMDIEMPGINGIEATRRLKAMPETRDIPVIALSAHDDRRRVTEAHQAGCAGYARKPIKVPELMAAIREALGGADIELPPVVDRLSNA